jgi:hypothetical protein
MSWSKRQYRFSMALCYGVRVVVLGLCAFVIVSQRTLN